MDVTGVALKLSEANGNAVKQAFYNTAANIFVVIACGAFVALYYVLESFLRPLLWAVLCGSFLHPFKYRVVRKMRHWLQGLKKSGTPLFFGLLYIPVNIVDASSESMMLALKRNWRTIASVALIFMTLYAAYHYVPTRHMFKIVQSVLVWIYEALSWFSFAWVSLTFVGYVTVLAFYWSPTTKRLLQVLSVPLWTLLIFSAIASAGAFQVPLAVAITVFVFVGAYAEIKDAKEKQQMKRDKVEGDVHPFEVFSNFMEVFDRANENESSQSSSVDATVSGVGDPDVDREPAATSVDESQTDLLASSTTDESSKLSQSSGSVRTMNKQTSTEPKTPTSASIATSRGWLTVRSASDRCFIALFWAIALVELWFNPWLVTVAALFVLFLGLKRLGSLLNVKVTALMPTLVASLRPLMQWLKERQDALVPLPLRGLVKLFLRGDVKVTSLLEKGADVLISIMFIVLLFICVLMGSFLVLVQVQKEGLHLVTLMSNIVRNSTTEVEWLSRYLHTNSTGIQDMLNPMINNFFVHGRMWLLSEIEAFLSGTSQSNRKLLEQRIVAVWDSIYESWAAQNSTPTAFMNRGSLFTSIQDGGINFMFEVFNIDFTSVLAFIKENIGTFISVFDSVWTVVKGNLNLAFSFGSSFLQLVFGGGSAILNFTISFVVFVTTLFLLLSSSGRHYKPVEWIALLSLSRTGSKFGQAVEDGIGGVFAATLKMAAFYGLYTWLTHTVFGINLVFLPSVLAAIFGAIPFIGTYWAALPAVLELWLVHGEIFLAILLISGHFLPTLFVDQLIYREIEGGGHPYLTGLAIAGGVYCFGLQGAIIGPVLLCCVVVATKVYSAMLTSPAATLTPGAADGPAVGGLPISDFTARQQLAKDILSRSNSGIDING